MKLLTIALMIMLSLSCASQVNCKKHPIYCKIKRIVPSTSHSYAMKLSNSIFNYSRMYELDSNLMTAIFAQESRFNLKAMNCRTGLNSEREETMVCFDFSIGQINFRTISRYDFDIELLMTDLDYAVESACIVMREFKNRYGHREFNYWSRYNSSSSSHRARYEALVGRYL